MADLIRVHPSTMRQWLEGRGIHMGCAKLLLDLLYRHPDVMMDLLLRIIPRRKDNISWTTKIAQIQSRLALSKQELLELLHIHHMVLIKIQRGEQPPPGCYTVLIDLLYYASAEIIPMLSFPLHDEPRTPEWTKKKLSTLLARLHLTTFELADFLGVQSQSIRLWLREESAPGSCTTLLLDLLQLFPEEMISMRESLQIDHPEAWTPERILYVREYFGIPAVDFAMLTNIDAHTLRRWETEGFSDRTACPIVLYSLIEQYPERFGTLLEKIAS